MNVNEDLLSDMSSKNKNFIITINYKQQFLLKLPILSKVLTCIARALLSNWGKEHPLQ